MDEAEIRNRDVDPCELAERLCELILLTSASVQSDGQSCPICHLTYAEILTEEEYATASDHFIGGAAQDLGLRILPCRQSNTNPGTTDQDHVVCGKCVRKWLRLVGITIRRVTEYCCSLCDVACAFFSKIRVLCAEP